VATTSVSLHDEQSTHTLFFKNVFSSTHVGITITGVVDCSTGGGDDGGGDEGGGE
jgi:hypothetical protein